MSNSAINNCATASDSIRHIYVHIPFCARICPYCAFYKERADSSQTARFCDAILGELDRHSREHNIKPRTIFFGDGTPTALSTVQLEFLLSGFRDRLDLAEMAEWTMEANPGSVSPRKAASLHRLGINRISLGVQSWDDELLRLLGREHNAAQAEASFHILREAGFKNLNIDLMFGLPGQSLVQWQETLARTIALQPDHVSAYCLTYEEDTDFFLRHSRGEFRVDTDGDARFFECAMEMLEESGYQQYEISNYARNGCASHHNQAYWAGADYLGIGPSAFSTVGLQRSQNIADYRIYSDRILSGASSVGSIEPLTPAIKQSERIALSLRTREGVSTDSLNDWARETNEFVALGLLRQANSNFALTRKGKLLADSVAEAFV